jgi:hypothetical protein
MSETRPTDEDAKPDPFEGPIHYERILELATHERPAKTLIALSHQNDPFYITPGSVGSADACERLQLQKHASI